MVFSQLYVRLVNALLVLGLTLLGTSLFAQESIVPERRLSISQNMDFPGKDLQPLFETTYKNCQMSCLGDAGCTAFTFNFKSNACFPKSDVSEKIPFEGANSAQVFDTDPAVLARQDARLKTLKFLSSRYLNEARSQAVNLARNYITNQWSADQLIEASRRARTEGRTLDAMKFMGATLNLTDAADNWAEMARLALEVKPKDNAEKRRMQQIATSASINSYMRGDNPAILVSALNVLAQGVEKRGNGRTAISVLRLAQSIQPRLETQEALDRVVSLYGFRLAEHSINNNAAAPRVCVAFSEYLVKAGVDYGDYVRLPSSGLVVESDENQVCISGVKHGERYRFTFRAGLPADSGEKLMKSVDLNVYIKDRDPSARFVGRAYVLPKGEAAAIPIVTVNLSEVDLKIFKVGERNLVRSVQNRLFGNPLAVWEEKNLADTVGAEVWSGTGIVAREVNRDVTTALPVGDAIADFEPGVYVMRARVPGADPYDSTAAAQWFIVTDLGLSTMLGNDGMHVFVRSLNTANAKAGVIVQMVARNNTVLGEAVTDAQGYARFAAGLTRGAAGNSPAMITVRDGDNDFAFLSLTDAAFDLSDRGVEGRLSPPPIDVFLTTDRGAYRVGETVYATTLARDAKAEALEGLPLTAIITRPDGVEFSRELLEDGGAGGRVFAVNLPRSAQRGTWNIGVYSDVDAGALVRQKFLVEDFTPERIDFDLTLKDGPITVDDVPLLSIDARYLYGAPGAGLTVEAETRVMLGLTAIAATVSDGKMNMSARGWNLLRVNLLPMKMASYRLGWLCPIWATPRGPSRCCLWCALAKVRAVRWNARLKRTLPPKASF